VTKKVQLAERSEEYSPGLVMFVLLSHGGSRSLSSDHLVFVAGVVVDRLVTWSLRFRVWGLGFRV